MFVETITAPREEWERMTEKLRVMSDPPEALVATVAWVGKDGLVTALEHLGLAGGGRGLLHGAGRRDSSVRGRARQQAPTAWRAHRGVHPAVRLQPTTR